MRRCMCVQNFGGISRFTRKGKRIFRMGSHEERHVHNPSLHGDSADQAYALCIVQVYMYTKDDI